MENIISPINHNLETIHKGLFVIEDCSGVTHSLSHASSISFKTIKKEELI